MLPKLLHFRAMDHAKHDLLFAAVLLSSLPQDRFVTLNLFLKNLDLRTETRFSFLEGIGLINCSAFAVEDQRHLLTGIEPAFAACCSLKSLSCSLMN